MSIKGEDRGKRIKRKSPPIEPEDFSALSSLGVILIS